MMSDRNPAPVHPMGALYRHGDVLIQSIAQLPYQAQPSGGATLAHGEVTGHSHRFSQPSAVQLWEQGTQLFVEVKAPIATLIHEEHHPIDLPRGLYRVWKQREYRPGAYVDVED